MIRRSQRLHAHGLSAASYYLTVKERSPINIVLQSDDRQTCVDPSVNMAGLKHHQRSTKEALLAGRSIHRSHMAATTAAYRCVFGGITFVSPAASPDTLFDDQDKDRRGRQLGLASGPTERSPHIAG